MTLSGESVLAHRLKLAGLGSVPGKRSRPPGMSGSARCLRLTVSRLDGVHR